MIKQEKQSLLMFKLSLLIFLLLTTLHAGEVKFFASSLNYENNQTLAKGDALLIQDKLILRADKILYHHQSNKVEAFGEIYLTMSGNEYLVSDYLLLDLNSDNILFEHLFIEVQKSNIWISTQNTHYKDKRYLLTNTITSSCNPKNPDWSLAFSSGEYNPKTEWVNLYNTRFYAGKVPIFYLPYFGFSTVTKRTSGFLSAQFGFSQLEGFLFEQPLFIAPSSSWDITVKPQVRSSRGQGINAELLFVDSPESSGLLEAGFFNDNQSYVESQNQANSQHSGFHFNYKRKNLFMDQDDSLYLDLDYLNDIDYLDLRTLNISQQEIPKILPSYFEYFIHDDSYFLGFDSKYFIDTARQSNKETLQIAPALNYHYFNKAFLDNTFMLGLDIENKNFTRALGSRASHKKLTLPLQYNLSLFDDYLNIKFKDITTLHNIQYFANTLQNEEHFSEIQNTATLTLVSNIAKRYNTYFHTMSFEGSINQILQERNSGKLDTTFAPLSQSKASAPTTFDNLDNQVELFFSQYLYNNQAQQLFVHRMRQNIATKVNQPMPELENEVVLTLGNGFSLVHFLRYSHQLNDISLTSNTLQYREEKYHFSFTQLYEKSNNPRKVSTNYNKIDTHIIFNEQQAFLADYAYDHLTGEDREWKITYIYKKKCWDIATSFRQEIIPLLTTKGTDSKTNDIIFIHLNLNPFGGFNQQLYESKRNG
jgi:LPS-assembly protein